MISFLFSFFWSGLFLKDIVFFDDFFFIFSHSKGLIFVSIFVFSLCYLFFYDNYFDSVMNFFSNHFLMNFLIFLSILIFLSGDPLTFIILMEMTMIPTLFLILGQAKNMDKLDSVVYFFSINYFGSIPFIQGIIYFNYTSFFMFSSNVFFSWIVSLKFFFFFSLVLFLKMPLFFFHIWLTKAHVEASGPISMILASVLIKMGTWGIYKFKIINKFFINYISFFILFFSLSLLFISFLMIRFFDIKKMIALSSILHMSCVPLLCVIMTYQSMLSSVVSMMGHGLISFFLFFFISKMYMLSQSLNIMFNKSVESFSKEIFWVFVGFFFMNMSIPPFFNFLGEIFTLGVLFCFSISSTLFFLIFMIMFVHVLMIFLSSFKFFKANIFFSGGLTSLSIMLSLFFFFLLFFLQSSLV